MSIFLEQILSTSFHGSLVILAVLALRLFLPRMPKKFVCYLWLLAGLRLLMPFEIQSRLSLQPDLTPILLEYGLRIPDAWWIRELPYVYIAVAFGFLVYMVCAYQRLKRQVREAVKIPGGWECDRIQTAFVLGFLRPRIYIPMNLPEYVSDYILEHEQTHLEKGDHWIKMVGFAALALHWFNPLVWVAYNCLSKDIELACDERVVQFMEEDERRAYSSALLCCSSNHAHFAACPVAFGEVSVKGRIFAVLEYRRPGFVQSVLSLLAVAFVAVCLVTSPAVEKNSLLWAQNLEMGEIDWVEVTSRKEEAVDAYQRLDGAEIARVVALIRAADGKSFDSHGFVPKGQETIILHMKDGSTHTVANMDDKYLIIDEDVYTARSSWLKTWELGGRADPDAPARPKSSSHYVRQRWAQDLRAQDVRKVEYVCRAEGAEFARATSTKEIYPWVERINAIDGELVKTARVAGAEENIFLDTTYVFLEDGSCCTVKRIAGAGVNYIAIDESVFEVSEEVFHAWPDTGSEPWPEGYELKVQPMEEEIPLDQHSRIENVDPWVSRHSRPEGFAAYDWMMGLQENQIERIEYVVNHDWQTPYRVYTGGDIGGVLALLQQNGIHAYQSAVEVSWGNYANEEFHILTKDGIWHKISSVGTVTVVIDGVAFETTSDWVMSWPSSGTDPWPEGREEELASRNYHMETDEQSIFSTSLFEQDRRRLDYQYDTNVEMGSASRTWPLGGWTVELRAYSTNSSSTILAADEYGNNRSGEMTFHSRFWLEQWQADATAPGVGGYVKLVPKSAPGMQAQTLPARGQASWYVSWLESYGMLPPGNYRIALNATAGEEEGILYAKFAVE